MEEKEQPVSSSVSLSVTPVPSATKKSKRSIPIPNDVLDEKQDMSDFEYDYDYSVGDNPDYWSRYQLINYVVIIMGTHSMSDAMGMSTAELRQLVKSDLTLLS